MLREFRQLSYSKYPDLLSVFTLTSIEAFHSHSNLFIWTCLMEKLHLLRMSSLDGARGEIKISQKRMLLITWVKEESLRFKDNNSILQKTMV